MSPRRSSRARTTQPTPSAQQHTNSSSSSISSGRADRSARPPNKLPSPRSSLAARSQSSEDAEARARPQLPRTGSSQDDPKNEAPPAIDDENDEEVEEEVTRCICGNQEYPGLPNADPTKIFSKDESDPASFAEDTTGWFIQCDICKVWQHGGCVGIMDEVTSPEEYFCERCRQELHRITVTANGYVPILLSLGSTHFLILDANTLATFPCSNQNHHSPLRLLQKKIRRNLEKVGNQWPTQIIHQRGVARQ